MSFGFLNPLFLAGLAALVAPILIHLVARRETRGRAFPSLMFLRAIPIKRSRRRTLRDPLLLLLRALALVFLVLAFSSPYFLSDDPPAVAASGVQQTVIALDRSYSMRFDDRWTRAIERARQEIARLTADDRAALVVFDDVSHTLAAMTSDRSHLLQALRAASAGHGNTDYSRVLAHAAQLFDQRLAGDKRVLLISDLQIAGLQSNRVPRLPRPLELVLENVVSAQPRDALLNSVQVLGSDLESSRVNLIAKLQGGGSTPGATKLRVRVDGHTTEERALTNAEIASSTAALSVVPARDHVSLVELSTTERAEHVYRLTLARVEPVKVTLISSEAASHSATYLQQALVLASRPQVVVQRVAGAALSDASLEHSDVLILDDAAVDEGATVARIEKFVNTGGGLLVLAGQHPQRGTPLLATSLVPGELGGELRATARLTEFARHPALVSLRTEQLRNAPVWRRRAMTPAPDADVLGRYSDGEAALIERQIGSGATIVLNTALNNEWSALALEPGFAPLTIGLVRHLAKRRSGAGASAATVGATVDIEQHAALLGVEALLNHLALAGAILAESPDGAVTKVAASQPALVPREAGFYRLHAPGTGAKPVPLAVNVDPRELQFESFSAAQFRERIVRETPRDRAPDAQQQVAEGTLRPTPWWYLLAGVVVLLMCEGFYAARLSSSTQAQRPATRQAG